MKPLPHSPEHQQVGLVHPQHEAVRLQVVGEFQIRSSELPAPDRALARSVFRLSSSFYFQIAAQRATPFAAASVPITDQVWEFPEKSPLQFSGRLFQIFGR